MYECMYACMWVVNIIVSGNNTTTRRTINNRFGKRLNAGVTVGVEHVGDQCKLPVIGGFVVPVLQV